MTLTKVACHMCVCYEREGGREGERERERERGRKREGGREGGRERERLTDEESSNPSLVVSMSSPLLETEECVAHLRSPGDRETAP